tara:strand:- start:26164 stop:26592 length:429 start_codon:yes stop_codon:yes gene_type:complete
MKELDENKSNTLEHILDLTKRKEISWSLYSNRYNKCEFKSKLDNYSLEANLSKSEKIQIVTLYLYIRYEGDDIKDLESNSDSIYIYDISLNKMSKELIDIIFTEHNYVWGSKKDSVFDSFLNDTAKPMMRDKKIDTILEDER